MQISKINQKNHVKLLNFFGFCDQTNLTKQEMECHVKYLGYI